MFSFNKFDACLRNSRELVCESKGSLKLSDQVLKQWKTNLSTLISKFVSDLFKLSTHIEKQQKK